MSIIWLIEDHKKTGTPLGRILLGNFAVRLIGSLKSFQQLTKIEKYHNPDVLIIDAELVNEDIQSCDYRISQLLPGVPRLYSLSSNQAASASWAPTRQPAKDAFFLSFAKASDLEIAENMRAILATLADSVGPQSLIRYKDIYLDTEKNVVGTLPETSEKIDLTLTESRILRLLLLHHGKCLSREKIRLEIWCGAKVSPRTIDSHVSRLRKHLSYAETTIESVYGGGYLLR